MAKRIFIGIELSEHARGAASARIARLRQAAADCKVSWVAPEKLHITLKFLGNVDDEFLPLVSNAAKAAASEFKSFGLVLRGTGVFPSRGRPKVLWVGIEGDIETAAGIKQHLDRALIRLNPGSEDKMFRPHLTLARLRVARKCETMIEQHLNTKFDAVPLTVSEVVVFESKLLPAGAVYSVISRSRLG